jgi:hypothetical protein
VKARRGWGKAIVATGHKILAIAFQMLRTNTPYRELGDNYFDQLHPARATKRLVSDSRLSAIRYSSRQRWGQMHKFSAFIGLQGEVF